VLFPALVGVKKLTENVPQMDGQSGKKKVDYECQTASPVIWHVRTGRKFEVS
jgi:hypothetical protein